MFKMLIPAAAAMVVSFGMSMPVKAAVIDLGFAIDESGSVSGTATTGELGLLRGGLASALDLIPSVGAPNNPNTYRVSIVRFASSAGTLVAPTIIDDTTRAEIQNTLLTASRFSGGTNIPSSIFQLLSELCPDLGAGNNCAADTTLFNIATDGAGGDPTISANPAAIAAGVEGISYEAIGGGLSPAAIANFAYPTPAIVVDADNIPNPLTQGFVVAVANFEDFESAIAAKVGRIVQDTGGGGTTVIPLPAGLPLLLTAFAGLFGLRRFRKVA